MRTYKNLSGKSNVNAYEYVGEVFSIIFKDGSNYTYSTIKNTLSDIQKMQELADAGSGLNTFLRSKPYHPHDRKW